METPPPSVPLPPSVPPLPPKPRRTPPLPTIPPPPCYITLGYEMGFAFTPLNGKRPTLPAWQHRARCTLAEALNWSKRGNIGLRTGRISGIVVIDIDEGADLVGLDLPATVEVETGSGGRHLYYTTGLAVKNSVGKLAAHVDVRGDGGQVVYPPSIHPETGKRYWFFKPLDRTQMAPLPQWIIDYQRPVENRTKAQLTRYIDSAISLECNAVSGAPEGTRNDTLNKAAFALGQLVSGGHVNAERVRVALRDAAEVAGLQPSEIMHTISSGLEASKDSPRRIETRTLKPAPAPRESGYLLIPGPHVTGLGEYIEQSNKSFSSSVISRLPADCLYNKANIPGEIIGEPGSREWAELKVDRARLIVDTHIKLGAWFTARSGHHKGEQLMAYKPCTKDNGGLIMAAAQANPTIRKLNLLTSYPIYGPGFERVAPGWHDGIYYDEPPALRGLAPITDIEIIQDTFGELVVDFPFKDEASRQNFFGLMLTPIVAPAVNGNRPLHLIIASLERTGKTKLAEEVLGGAVLGEQTAALQITDRDEERDKRLLALLLLGKTIIHLDNLPQRIDSAALASMLTATNYQGRVLGSTKIVNLPNNMTIVGSGNNLECSGEIVKRSVPILLQPRSPRPEARVSFQHPNLVEHVRKARLGVLACLLGMVENWKKAGCPRHAARMGGFESWSESIGGILKVNGFNQWRSNEGEWRQSANPESAELIDFVAAWHETHGYNLVSVADLIKIAARADVFSSIVDSKIMFGKFIRRRVNLPVERYIIKKKRTGSGLFYQLSDLKDAK